MMYQYNKLCNSDRLTKEITESSITIALDYIVTETPSTTKVYFKAELPSLEEDILDTIINLHVNTPLDNPDVTAVRIIENEANDIDQDARAIVRVAFAKPGWSYIAYPLEFTTAKFDALYNKDYLGNDKNEVTVKFYNESNNEVTSPGLLNANEATITRTEVLFKPEYDYELIMGSIRQDTNTNQDARLWVIAGIVELGGAYVKEFTGGINLRYVGADEEFKTDGKASKYMKKTISGVPYNGNQLKVIIRHPAGLQHRIMITLEFFRE